MSNKTNAPNDKAPAGSGERPRMVIDLTPSQGDEIAPWWDKFGGIGKAMMAQPGNLMDGRYTKLKIVVLSIEEANAVAAIVKPPNTRI